MAREAGTMNNRQIRANRPASLLKTGAEFTDERGTEWTIVVSSGDGTAAVESEDDAGEFSNGTVYICEEGDTYGANGVPEYIVKNGSWYKNTALDVKKDEFKIRKNACFRKKDRRS